MNHTPGPWAFLDCALVQDTGNRLHLGVFHEAPGLGRAAAGNARLICAAPAMLAALRLLVRGDGQPDECARAMRAAREALALAEGQQ